VRRTPAINITVDDPSVAIRKDDISAQAVPVVRQAGRLHEVVHVKDPVLRRIPRVIGIKEELLALERELPSSHKKETYLALGLSRPISLQTKTCLSVCPGFTLWPELDVEVDYARRVRGPCL